MRSDLSQAIILLAFSIAALYLYGATGGDDAITAGIAGGAFVASYSKFLNWLFNRKRDKKCDVTDAGAGASST